MEDKLTPKQERFVDEYLIDFNGTRAAIAAGYSEKTANEQAAQNLVKLSIQHQIEKKQAETAQKLQITKEEIIMKLISIAETANPTQQIRAYEVINSMLGFKATEKSEITIKEQPLFGGDELTAS